MDSARKYINALTDLYLEELSISDKIKELKDEAREEGLNPTILSAVAKAIANGKVPELEEKSESILNAIEISRS